MTITREVCGLTESVSYYLGEGLPSHHLGNFPDLRDANFNQSNAFGAPYPKCHPFVSLK